MKIYFKQFKVDKLYDVCGTDGMTLKWFLKHQDGGVWTVFKQVRIGMTICEYDNEPSGGIKCREYLD